MHDEILCRGGVACDDIMYRVERVPRMTTPWGQSCNDDTPWRQSCTHDDVVEFDIARNPSMTTH